METGNTERWCCCKNIENKFITCHQRATLFCSGEDVQGAHNLAWVIHLICHYMAKILLSQFVP